MEAAALMCSICPKRPTFSDVSHLLTHVSSKAHLSHYFKLQIRSHQESDAREKLEGYETWYKSNNVPKLLTDRMASKEARRRKSVGKDTVDRLAKGRPTTNTTKAMTRKQAAPQQPTVASPRKPLSNPLEPPQLPDPFVNLNLDNVVGHGSAIFSSSYMMPSTPQRACDGFLPSYPYPSPPRRPTPTPWKQEPESGPEDETNAFLSTIPVWGGRLRRRSGASFPVWHKPSASDPFVSDDDTVDDIPVSKSDEERRDEMLRLKGVLWPGMNIFDGATEQMRRKRNQKKDESVLRMMERTSKGVEPTELVFSPTGALRKQRVISGDVEDGSPLPGEIAIPRRAPRAKRGLSQIDPNVQYVQNRKRAKKSMGYDCNKEFPRRSARISRITPTPLLMDLCSSHGDDDDFDLTVRNPESRSRSGFSVFQDEPETCNPGDQVNESPIATPVLPHRDATSCRTLSSALFPEFTKNPACLTADEARLEAVLSEFEKSDPPLDMKSSPILSRPYVSDAPYLPQYFLGESPRAGFGLFDTSLPRLQSDDEYLSPAKSNFIRNKEPPVARDFPDPLISEAEEDEFERFCLNGSFF